MLTMAFIYKVLLIVLSVCNLTFSSTQDQAVGNCPPLWTKFQNHCYRFYGGPKSWIDAELLCRNMATCNSASSAHLVSIHNKDENSFVFDYWQSSLVSGCTSSNPRLVDSVWIGLNDIDTDGSMVWSDGTSNDFSKWRPNEPSGGTEDCTHMYNRGDYVFGDKWNDIPCTTVMPFICKMPTN